MGMLSLLTGKSKKCQPEAVQTEVYRQNPDFLENGIIENYPAAEQPKLGHTEGSGIMNPRQMKAAIAEMSSHHPLTVSTFQRRVSVPKRSPKVAAGKPVAMKAIASSF